MSFFKCLGHTLYDLYESFLVLYGVCIDDRSKPVAKTIRNTLHERNKQRKIIHVNKRFADRLL